MKYKIEYEYDIERVNDEATMKGWRSDVLAIINDKKYKLYITDLLRLSQDFQSEVLEQGYYQIEPNIIIVKKLTKDEIERTISKLIDNKFFEELSYSQLYSEKRMTMDDILIEFNDNDDNFNKEMVIRGYRKDVQVIIKNKRYNLYIATLVRLFQDLVRDDVLNSFEYLNHPNLVIVNSLNRDKIIMTLKKLYDSGYFDKLGSIEDYK